MARVAETRLEALEARQEPPTNRLALDADVPDELVERIMQSSRAHLDDPTDSAVTNCYSPIPYRMIM